jgi:hypothetical protein
MESKDGKFFNLNISLRQWVGIGALLAITAVVVYYDAVIFGYVAVVLALSAFFIVVGFDLGLPKGATHDVPPIEDEPVAETMEPRRGREARGARNSRTARTA